MEIESGSSRRISSAQAAAAKAEGQASKRIEQARKRVREAETEAQAQLEAQRDSYEKRAEVERARQEGALEKQRYQGYERVREVQRVQDQEENRVRREGEKTVADLKTGYDTATQRAESDGEKKYRQTLAQNFQQEEMLRRRNEDQIDTFTRDTQAQLGQLKADRDLQVETTLKAAEAERLKLQKDTRDAIAANKDHYADIYDASIRQQRDAMGAVNAHAAKELESLKQSNSHRLNAYSDRSNDPFYRMVNLNAEVTESAEAFVLRARIPEHEQDRIQINVRGNEIVISGQRRNEEKVEHGPGRTQITSSYQSFSESFPIHWPVEPKGMVREFHGDQLIVQIPKKATYAAEQFKAKKTAERATLQKPQFPKNLPGEKELNEQLAQLHSEENVSPNQRSKFRKTLA